LARSASIDNRSLVIKIEKPWWSRSA